MADVNEKLLRSIIAEVLAEMKVDGPGEAVSFKGTSAVKTAPASGVPNREANPADTPHINAIRVCVLSSLKRLAI